MKVHETYAKWLVPIIQSIDWEKAPKDSDPWEKIHSQLKSAAVLAKTIEHFLDLFCRCLSLVGLPPHCIGYRFPDIDIETANEFLEKCEYEARTILSYVKEIIENENKTRKEEKDGKETAN